MSPGTYDDSLVALVSRFESGGFRARDVAQLLLAGLRGGGWSGNAGTLNGANGFESRLETD